MFIIERRYVGPLEKGLLLKWHKRWVEWHVYRKFKTAKARASVLAELSEPKDREYCARNFEYRTRDELVEPVRDQCPARKRANKKVAVPNKASVNGVLQRCSPYRRDQVQQLFLFVYPSDGRVDSGRCEEVDREAERVGAEEE